MRNKHQLLLTAIVYSSIAITVSANYTLNITLVSYNNPTNWCPSCSDDQLGCCDNYDSTVCTGSLRCDTYFEYCLLPVETDISRGRIQCTPVATSSVLDNDGPIDFNQSVVLGLSNPLLLSGISSLWTGILLQVSALDSDGSNSHDFIDVFQLQLTVSDRFGSVMLTGYHSLAHMALTYQVMCNEGFYGEACQFFNNCPSQNVCGENGTCIDGENNYTCQCNLGYMGDHCEVVDHCFGVTCSDQGRCVAGENSYICQCYASFTGVDCETNIGDCSLVNCSKQGDCIGGNSSHTCDECGPGYVGNRCQTSIINECSKDGGSCSKTKDKLRARIVIIIGATLGCFSLLLLLFVTILTVAILATRRKVRRSTIKSDADNSEPKRHGSFNLTANIGYGVMAEVIQQQRSGEEEDAYVDTDEVSPRYHTILIDVANEPEPYYVCDNML